MRRHIWLLCCSCWLACAVARAEILTGVVLTEDGKPAAGATLTAFAFHSIPVRLTAKTDEQGSFQIDLPSAENASYSLAVRWQGQGVHLSQALDAEGKPADIKGQQLPAQIIRLRTEGHLRGRLLQAEDDGPIAGAKLFLDTGEVLTTDEHGAFEVAGLPMRDHSLIPVTPGRVRQYVLFETTLRPEAELEVRLPRGAVVRGRILDEHDQPISGAYVVRRGSGSGQTLSGWYEACQADGSFEFGGLSTQRLVHNLEVAAPGYREQSISLKVDASTDVLERTVRLAKESTPVAGSPASDPAVAAGPAPSTVKLPRRTITGTVTNEAGQPVADAQVCWGTFRWNPSTGSTQTDKNGKFTLANAPGEAGAILVITDRFAPKFVPARPQAERIDVRLSAGQTVRGVVRSTSGEPVTGVQITTLLHCRETGYCTPFWFEERATQTNQRGEFELTAIPTAASFDVLKQGYSERRGVSLVAGDKLNEIQLTPGGAIRGQVVDSAGKPVRNFKVTVTLPRVFRPEEVAGGVGAAYRWYGITYTRVDGVFVFTDVNAGDWFRLIVTAPGIGLAVLDRVQAETLDQLSPPEMLTIQLKPYAPLRVKVVDGVSKQPVTGAGVSLLADQPAFSRPFNWSDDDLWAARARTGEDGTADFSEPGGEDGTLVIQAPGFARQRIGAASAEKTWNVSLQPQAVLKGEVRLKDKPLADGFVRLTFAGSDAMGVDLKETGGRFEFDQLPAGDYELTILNNRGQSLQTQKFKLESGQTHTENVTVSPPSGSKTEA